MILEGHLKNCDFSKWKLSLPFAYFCDILVEMDYHRCFLYENILRDPLYWISKFFEFWLWEIWSEKCPKMPKIQKITNFQFWISRPIQPIFMICKLGNVSLGIFDRFPRNWTYSTQIRWKIGFFDINYHFWPVLREPANEFFVEISTGVEISTVKFLWKKTCDHCWHPP